MLLLASITLFLAVLLLVLGYHRSTSRYAVGRRIEDIKAAEPQTAEEELEKPFVQRVVLPIGDAAARLFRNFTPAEISDNTQKKLVMAGLYPHVTPAQLQGLCWFSAGGCVLAMGMLIVVQGLGPGGTTQLQNPWNIAYLLIAAAGGFAIPQFIVSRKVSQRQEDILVALPYAIDLLSISVEAGMGFDAAVGYVMRKTKGPLAEEFSKTLNEIRLGKPRLEALEHMGDRTGVEDLKMFVTAVVHASRLGSSITTTLRVQADSMRVRRRQRAQEQAMKAPVKLVFPLVFFIFPALFVVILGPPIITIFKEWVV
jgi:tight adherence protein C